MNCNLAFKKIKELLNEDITQIPNYISDLIKEDPDNNYITICSYIVNKHNSFIKELENKLQKYIKDKEELYDLISNTLTNNNILNFNTILTIIYYLNKDIKNLQINNTRIYALLDTLKDMNKRKNI